MYHPYGTTRDLQKQLQKLMTTQVIAERFNVTPMTIYNWRTERGMPCVNLPGEERPAIRFVWDDVRAWALQQGIVIPGEPQLKIAPDGGRVMAAAVT